MNGFSHTLVSILAWSLSFAHAGTVTLTTAGGRSVLSSSGNPVSKGSLVRIGTFKLPAATLEGTLASTKNLQQLSAWFAPLAEGIAGAGTTQQPSVKDIALRTNDYPAIGGIFATVKDISSGYLATGTPLYVWVFNAPTVSGASEWGLYSAATWKMSPSLGSQSLSTSSAVQALRGSVTETALVLEAVPPTFQSWANRVFPVSIPSALQLASADADGDGINNLAEYAWGSNPLAKTAARTRFLSPTAVGDTAKFSFEVPTHLSDVTVVAEQSSDLKVWTPAPTVVTATAGVYETHTVTSTPGVNRFWRVSIREVSVP
jgi:hypothetical protein